MTEDNIAPDARFAESLSDLMLEDQIRAHDKTLRWQPRDRSKAVARWQRRLAGAEAKRTGLDARYAECVFKAHRYRYVPWLGKAWQQKLEQARADLEAAKAEARWARHKLEQARLTCEKRKAWQRTFAPEIAEREALRTERSRRQRDVGERRLGEMRSRGGVAPAEGTDEARRWAEAHGKREWAGRLREQRQQEREQRQQERGDRGY